MGGWVVTLVYQYCYSLAVGSPVSPVSALSPVSVKNGERMCNNSNTDILNLNNSNKILTFLTQPTA